VRRRLFVVGAVLLSAGVLVFVYSMVATTTVSIPLYPSEQVLDGVHAFGSATMEIRWSGGVAATILHVYRCTVSDCSTGGPEVGNATGSSGTMAVGIVGGASYALSVTGPSSNVTAAINLIGITTLGLVGMVVLLAGIGVIALAVRRPADRSGGAPIEPPSVP
jgi:hypothetical protein